MSDVCFQIAEIRAALISNAKSQANLRRGLIECRQQISDVVGPPKFSPNGSDFAVLVRGCPGAVAYHVCAGDDQSEGDDDYEGEEDEDHNCLMVYLAGALPADRLCISQPLSPRLTRPL